jgi:hypothetical protein
MQGCTTSVQIDRFTSAADGTCPQRRQGASTAVGGGGTTQAHHDAPRSGCRRGSDQLTHAERCRCSRSVWTDLIRWDQGQTTGLRGFDERLVGSLRAAR